MGRQHKPKGGNMKEKVQPTSTVDTVKATAPTAAPPAASASVQTKTTKLSPTKGDIENVAPESAKKQAPAQKACSKTH